MSEFIFPIFMVLFFSALAVCFPYGNKKTKKVQTRSFNWGDWDEGGSSATRDNGTELHVPTGREVVRQEVLSYETVDDTYSLIDEDYV